MSFNNYSDMHENIISKLRSLQDEDLPLRKWNRRETHQVKVGDKFIGSKHPILVQSMALGGSGDPKKDAEEVVMLARAGSELVRVAINCDEAMKTVPYMRDELVKHGFNEKMIVGCGQYEIERLLYQYPESAKALGKIRINPGNVGFGSKWDYKFDKTVELAAKFGIPIRIGVNWGSLNEELKSELMDRNSASANPRNSREILQEALVVSTISSAMRAEDVGMPKDMIVVSCKTSTYEDTEAVMKMVGAMSKYPIHLGRTEAGIGRRGIINAVVVFSPLLRAGIGDTIRASLTPRPSESRATEVMVCQETLQAMGIRNFAPQVTSCPGCNRTSGSYLQELSELVNKYIDSKMPEWSTKYVGVENMVVAVMGCVVNGPGESKHSNIGISLPGAFENPVAVVYADGKKLCTLKGQNIYEEFTDLVEKYVESHYQVLRATPAI